MFVDRFVLPLLLLASLSHSLRADEIDILEQRLKDHLLARPGKADKGAAEYMASLQADGTWSDIRYDDTSRTGWKPIAHLDRLLAMARACTTPGQALSGKPELKAKIHQALGGWIARAPHCSNWWYNDISVPQKMGEILLLTHSELSPAEIEASLKIVSHADQGRKDTGTNTGANRVDRAYATILRGVVARQPELVRESFLAIGDTMKITEAEGIQPDYSFHQHGAQLYMRGYGLVFIDGTIKYGTLGAGTSFTYSSAQVHTLVDFLIEGMPWFIRGDSIDITAAGRGISRKGNASSIGGLAGQIDRLLTFNQGYRSGDLQTFRDRLRAAESTHAADPKLALSGNRYFWRSDVMEHHRPDYAVSVKTSSNHTVVPETGNGEGLKNLHLADGVTLIQRSGNEYDEIMPVWDWYRLPGTTTERGNYPLEAAGWSVPGISTCTGGVSDGTYGASSFDYRRLNVSAHKSWFFFDREVVALGAAIEAPKAKSAVETSLNQCLLNGPILYRTAIGGVQTLTNGSASPGGLRWVHHDGVGYVFPAPVSTATIEAKAQTGTWQSINDGYDATPVTRNVFSLDLNHGTATNHGQYAYTIVPGISAAEMDAYQAGNPIQILSNTPAVQAVKHLPLGITSAMFWSDEPSTMGGISVDRRACVMVRTVSGALEVSVSDPTQTGHEPIRVTLAVAADGEITSDAGITTTRSATTVTLTIQVKGSQGRSFHARIPRKQGP